MAAGLRSRPSQKSKRALPGSFPVANRITVTTHCDDKSLVKPAQTFLRPVAAACLLLAGLGAGCSSTREAPRLARTWTEAEIAVSNLTPYPWRIALRPKEGEPKLVQVQPRETFAIVLAGGDYSVEQTLVSGQSAAPTTRNFSARFEPGERYRWSLATLLASDEAAAP